MKITEIYSGQEFEIIIGNEYEFSDDLKTWEK